MIAGLAAVTTALEAGASLRAQGGPAAQEKKLSRLDRLEVRPKNRRATIRARAGYQAGQ